MPLLLIKDRIILRFTKKRQGLSTQNSTKSHLCDNINYAASKAPHWVFFSHDLKMSHNVFALTFWLLFWSLCQEQERRGWCCRSHVINYAVLSISWPPLSKLVEQKQVRLGRLQTCSWDDSGMLGRHQHHSLVCFSPLD